MSVLVSQRKYAELADALLLAFGGERTQTSLAEQLFVAPQMVSLWFSGKCRPRPHRLGLIAAILGLNPEKLADLAGYNEPPKFDEVVAACDWYKARQKKHNSNYVEKRLVCVEIVSKIEEVLVGGGALNESQWEEWEPELFAEVMELRL